MTAHDAFSAHQAGLTSPADDFVAVTKSDTANLPFRCRGIYVGGTGDVIVLAQDMVTSVTFTAVPAGTLLPIRTSRVMNGSTATAMVALK